MELEEYLSELMFYNHTLRMESIPYDVLQDPEIQKKLVALDPKVQNSLSLLHHTHYRGIAWWMRFLGLERYQVLGQNEFDAFFNLRLEAEFAIARVNWAISIYPFLPLAQAYGSHENLWYMLEVSDFMKWIELMGLTGSPALNNQGRLLGKVEGLELDIRELEAFKNDFRLAASGSLISEKSEESECEPEYMPTLTEALLADAHQYAAKSDGDDIALASACFDFIDAKLKLQWAIRKKKNAESHLAYYLASPHQLFITRKGLKTPRPDFMPKRGRGRPPKGSNVKKY